MVPGRFGMADFAARLDVMNPAGEGRRVSEKIDTTDQMMEMLVRSRSLECHTPHGIHVIV